MTARRSALALLRSEIDEQPDVVARLLETQRGAVERAAEAIRAREPSAIVLVARGSSDNAAVYGRYLFEVRNRLLTSLAAPSTRTLYESGPRLADAVVLGVSQSGRGEDVVTYMRSARAQGARTIAVVNDVDSPLAETAEWVLDCGAGPELSVPATKTVTAQMTLLAMLSYAIDGGTAEKLAELPPALTAAVRYRRAAAALAGRLASVDSASVIGRGFAYPAALEIALKLKEASYTAAEPFSAADFRHGPIALVEPGYGALCVDVGGHSSEPALRTAQDVGERGGQPFLLRAGRLQEAPAGMPKLELDVTLDETLATIPAVVLGQLLAIELALARGLDPAQPRGLRKVTSTR